MTTDYRKLREKTTDCEKPRVTSLNPLTKRKRRITSRRICLRRTRGKCRRKKFSKNFDGWTSTDFTYAETETLAQITACRPKNGPVDFFRNSKLNVESNNYPRLQQIKKKKQISYVNRNPFGRMCI